MQMQTIELFKAISLTEYDVNTKKDLLNYLRKHFNNAKSKLFLFSRRSNSPQIILLDLKLPGVFQSQSFDVNLLIYFPVRFPTSGPEIYLKNMGNLKINPQCLFYISEDSLKINYDLFIQWKCQLDDLASILTELKHQFSFAFPVFNVNNNQMGKQFTGDCVFPMKSVMEIIMPSASTTGVASIGNAVSTGSDINNDISNLKINISTIEPIQQQQSMISNSIRQQPLFNNTNNNFNINSISSIAFDQSSIMRSKTMNAQNVSVNNIALTKEGEERAKKKLLIQLILQFKGKIREQVNKNRKDYLDLKYLKQSYEKKIGQLNLIENNRKEINTITANLEKEINEYNLPSLPDQIDTTDMSNLGNLFEFNEKLFSAMAKENALEELLALIKKGFEKEVIDFNSAIKLYRVHSRLLFFVKKSQEINLKK